MPNASRTGEKGKGLAHEITGIAVLALALYAGVCVFSGAVGAQKGGVAGELISRLIFKTVGHASYILPLFLLAIGLKLLLRRALAISAAAPASIGVFMLAGAALMAEVTGGNTAGGAVGKALAAVLAKYAGRTGSLIFLVSLLVASVLAFSSTAFSPRARQAHEDAQAYGGDDDGDNGEGRDEDEKS